MLPNLAAKMEKFQEVDARLTDPSRFYAPSQTLYLQRGRLGKNLAFTVPETPIIYLRVMPTQSTAPLKRADAIDLFREGSNQLNPFYHRVSGSSSQANEFGTITFDANYDEGEIHCAAQLFLNREIWAFNTSFLSPDLARARSNTVLGVPTLAVEQTFAIHLPRYARFMNDALGVPPPYRIEGGAFGVKDYVLFMPTNYFETQWGPIHQNHVCWSGVLPSLEARDVDAALLKIFEAFFDAGACARPKQLYGFPGDAPGKISNG